MLSKLFLALGGAQALELTSANWDEKTAGKVVLVKFLAPWCGHCKSMKPAWDKLMEAFKDDASRLIADVDCTAAGKSLCETHGVRGYPTIKHGDPNGMDDYKGGRDFDALKKFVDGLKALCSPANPDLCSDEEKKKIDDLQALDADKLDEKIKEEEKKLEEAEKNFKEKVEKLQKEYQDLSKAKDDEIAAVKAGGLGLMKSVKAIGKAKSKDEL